MTVVEYAFDLIFALFGSSLLSLFFLTITITNVISVFNYFFEFDFCLTTSVMIMKTHHQFIYWWLAAIDSTFAEINGKSFFKINENQ